MSDNHNEWIRNYRIQLDMNCTWKLCVCVSVSVCVFKSIANKISNQRVECKIFKNL